MSRSFRVGLILPSSNTTMEDRAGRAAPTPPTSRSRPVQPPFRPHADDPGDPGRARRHGPGERPLRRRTRRRGMRHRRLRLPRRRDGRRQSRPHWCGKATLTSSLDGATHPSRDQHGRTRGNLSAMGQPTYALIAPYLPSLTQRVVDYLADLGIEVVPARSALEYLTTGGSAVSIQPTWSPSAVRSIWREPTRLSFRRASRCLPCQPSLKSSGAWACRSCPPQLPPPTSSSPDSGSSRWSTAPVTCSKKAWSPHSGRAEAPQSAPVPPRLQPSCSLAEQLRHAYQHSLP